MRLFTWALLTVAVCATSNCDWDETKNIKGPSRCSTDSQCTGARTCTKFGWCEGDPECPAAASCAIVEEYKSKCEWDSQCLG